MESKLSIMFFYHYTDMNNGAVRSMTEIIDRLVQKYGIKATVVYSCDRGNAIEYLEKIGVHCYRVRFGRLDYKYNDKFHKIIFTKTKLFVKYMMKDVHLKELNKIAHKEKINLLYTNTTVLYIGALMAQKSNIPLVWHIREFGKEDHGFDFLFGEESLYKMIDNSATAVIYISNSIREKYQSHITCRQYVIYNDISPQFINSKEERFVLNEPIKVAIIGAIQEGKGQLEAIKAIEILNKNSIKAILYIAGRTSGAYYQKIQKYVESKSISNYIKFDGFIRNTNEYRKKMDVGIVASSSEAFGRVTIEGMLSGMLMVGANSAGTKELIKDCETGLLYELHNPGDLAEKINWICEHKSEAIMIADNGFKYAIENFTMGKAADKIHNVLHEIIERG